MESEREENHETVGSRRFLVGFSGKKETARPRQLCRSQKPTQHFGRSVSLFPVVMSFPPILNPYIIAFFHPDGSSAVNEYTLYLRPGSRNLSITLTYDVFPFVIDSPQPLNCASSTMIFALNLAHAHSKVKTILVEIIESGFAKESKLITPVTCKVTYNTRHIQVFLWPWLRMQDFRMFKPGNFQRFEFQLFKISGAIPATAVVRVCWAQVDMHIARYRRKFIGKNTLAQLEDAVKEQRLRLLFKHRHVWP